MKPTYSFLCNSALLLACAIPAVVAAAPQTQTLRGHVPAATARQNLLPTGRLPGTNRLTLVFGLPFRNREQLTNLLDQIYDPASTNYQRLLTPEQFTENFGPSEQDYQAVTEFAKRNGFTVTRAHRSRRLLDVISSVANAERVFHLVMRVYDHPNEPRKFFAPDTEPTIDSDVPLLHITGLDNYFLPHRTSPRHERPSREEPKPNFGSAPDGYSYMGNDFRAAYAPDVALKGDGQIVGLLELDGYDLHDVWAYQDQAAPGYGYLPLPWRIPFEHILLDGATGSAGTNAGEVVLDIDMVISMAPRLAKVVVYEAPINGTSWVDILDEMANPTEGEPRPSVLSCSWSIGNDPNADNAYIQFRAQNQTFFQSSGDHGAYPTDQWADNFYTTIVGGTSLNTIGRNWSSDTVWPGSGGGTSRNYPIPYWQEGIDMSANGGSTTMRNVPDVAMAADNIWLVVKGQRMGGWYGTSASAPLWAGFMALVNQQRAANGQPPIGFANPALYAIGKSAIYNACFHDITVGNNENGGSPNLFSAAPGYDLCTGWGTPTGQNLIDALAPPMPHIDSVSPISFLTSPSPQPLYIYGSGFTASSTLLFNGSIVSDPTRLQVKSANEIDYKVIVQSTGTWSVQVVNGIQRSNAKNFTVNNPPPTTGSLVVNLSPDGIGGQWQVDGTGYNNSGYAVGYLSPGAHSVSFKPIAGYTTPANLSVNIMAGQQTTTNATYTPIAPTTYTLALSAANGQITPSPSGWNGSAYVYNSGSVVQLTANANIGYHFASWGGDASGTVSPTTVTMNGNKTVSANFATGDPNLATVTVTIKPDPAANAGVTWSVTGDSQLRASGTSLSEAVGSGYTTYLPVTLNLVAGWLGANGNTSFLVPLAAGIVTNVTLTCVPDTTPGLLTVTLSPQDAVNAGAHWHVNGGAAQGNGASLSLAPGTYTVTFDSVSGWTAPTTQTVTVSRAQTTVLSGNYTPPAGQPLIAGISPSIGPVIGGTHMTINGANFTVPAVVMIGGQPASNIVVSSATQITCLTPPATNYGSASVVVQTAGGNATNANGFAYGLQNGSKIDLLGSIGGSCFAVAVQSNYAYVGEGRNMLVLDVSSPSTPSKIGHVALPGIVRAIALFGHYAYVAAQEGGVQVVDISSPATPAIRGAFRTSDYTWTVGITIFAGRAYVANENLGLQVLDLGNPAIPSLMSATNIGGAEAVVVKATANGTLAYVSTAGNLSVVDVSNPQSPRLRGETSINGGSCYSIAMSGNYVFAASAFGNLEIMDVSNPDSPSDIGHAPGAVFTRSVGTANNYVYATSSINGGGFYVFSLSGGTLTQIGNIPQCSADAYNMAFSGTTAYVPDSASGVKIVDISSPNNPSQLTTFSDSGVFRQYNSVAVTQSSMAACGYPEGTVVGFNTVFDVSNPSLPVFTANPNVGGSFVLARNGIAYVLAGNSNFIFNVATPSSPRLLKLFSNTAVPGVSMALGGDLLYTVGYNDANQPHLAVFDVSSPASPVIKWTKDFPAPSSGAATAVAVSGNRVLVGIQINTSPSQNQAVSFDISNPSSPVQQGVYTNLAFSPRSMELSPDGRFAYVCGGHPSTVSILDLTQPSMMSSVTNIQLDPSIATGSALEGGELFVTTFQGLYVFDIGSPGSPVLTRSYQLSEAQELSVSSESPNQSGSIYVADLDGGLVVLREQDTQVPHVFITTPWSLPSYTNAASTISLGGGSDDNLGVTAMTWANHRGGSGQVSAPFDNWYVTGIPLYPGINLLTVTAFDAAGNSGSDILTVNYQAPKQDQTITFLPIADHKFGDPPVSLTAAASSGLPVGFSVVSGPASWTNNVLTLLGAGAVTVQADQPGNDSFNPAPPVDVSFNVAKADQSIAFAPVPDKSAGDAPFALSATASSGLPVYFDIVSGPAAVDTNNIVTLLGGGVVTVSAWQPGNSNYNAAVTVQRSFNVAKIPQTISFGPLSRQTVGDAPFALSASANSGLLVSFAVVSGPAVLSGNIVTLTGPGLVTVRASQPGNAVYAAAVNVDQSFYVVRGNNLITDAQWPTNGQFSLVFAGDFGRWYVVEYSPDLVSWTPLLTNTVNSLGLLEFTDETAARRTQSFYRVQSQP